MKFFLTLFLIAVLGVAVVQVVELYTQKEALAEEIDALEEEASSLQAQNRDLEKDIEYFEEDRNLGKEFRSKFNYKDPRETMVILVPTKSE